MIVISVIPLTMFKLVTDITSPVLDRRMIIKEEDDTDLRDFQTVSSDEPAVMRLRNFSDDPDQRTRTQSFSLNRNLCSERQERDRANTFTHSTSSNYLERIKQRRQQQVQRY